MIIEVPNDLIDLGGYLKAMGICTDQHNTPDYANVISGEKKIPYFGLNWDGTRIVIVDKRKNEQKLDEQLIAANKIAYVFPSEMTKPLTGSEAIQNAINSNLEYW